MITTSSKKHSRSHKKSRIKARKRKNKLARELNKEKISNNKKIKKVVDTNGI